MQHISDVTKDSLEHERTVMRQQSDPAHVVMPGVHRVASLLKRWLLGTHQLEELPVGVRERAAALLDTSDGADPAARREARERAERAVAARNEDRCACQREVDRWCPPG
jgi:hypothetical protein